MQIGLGGIKDSKVELKERQARIKNNARREKNKRSFNNFFRIFNEPLLKFGIRF